MSIDVTIVFSKLYFNLNQKNIQIILNNKQVLTGYINGYYYEDIDAENKTIAMWHFVEANDSNSFSTTETEYKFSKLIPHKLIKEVLYTDNNNKSQKIKFD